MPLPIWDDFNSGMLQYAIDAFNAIDIWFWPFVFIGIIGYLYAAMESVTVAVVGILITFGLFATTTSIFADVPELSQFLYIIAIIGITLLITALFIKRMRS